MITRFNRFVERNRGKVFASLTRQIYGGLYLHSCFQKPMQALYRPKEPKKWLFLVGCYNSGTTILREILGAHCKISVLPREGVRYTNVLKSPEDLGWVRNWHRCEDYISMPPQKNPEQAESIKKSWAPLWDRKAPVYLESIANVARMQWLDLNFKNAYFIGIIRMPYSVCEGIKRRARPRDRACEQLGREEYTYEDVAHQWLHANQRMFEFRTKVKRFLLVRYENLMRQPNAVMDDIFGFIEEDKSPVLFDQSNSAVIHGRRFQLKDMNPGSCERLSRRDVAHINQVLHGQLEYFGYEEIEA